MPAYREEAIADEGDYEKQISVDPLSLKQLAITKSNVFSRAGTASGGGAMQLLAPPDLVPPKFISCTLPGSALSSPRSAMPKSPNKQQNSHFAWELANNSFRRSKSCGEGRSSSPSVEFIGILSRSPSIRKQPADGGAPVIDAKASEDNSFKHLQSPLPPGDCDDDKFKCRCLFLPGLSHKKKQVALRHAAEVQLHVQEKEEPLQLSKISFHGLQLDARESADRSRISTVSNAASLEKFSCGSWSSSALLESDDGRHSYFDLPLELIRNGHNETDSPVRAAFLFEKDLKGVLKKTSSNLGARKSQASTSNRHVRFSTSAPTSCPASPSSTCITPRLRKAREDFNAFLAAQNA
ncbi:hypothetical protein Cni_G23957 [Canna indica]|uniref:Uncharacterized protein n=1 Tax=Canna indica TaxID=4628 RepID=A0AAQ3KZE3_9LILI|nr:hypothetical protein Cni_G23957 [Canna indica]